ncbi:MAG TPA: hypothetical protein ENJ50_04760 [Planctomycetaceae bacterium]|nr:hypothetical protein [Planctomycetaceae bacterium]
MLQSLRELTRSTPEVIHIVGGGTQNTLLCQMTADACATPVIAGPVEATAMGNLVMQAIASGELQDIDEARSVVRESSTLVEYEPAETEAWDEAAARWSDILQLGTRS